MFDRVPNKPVIVTLILLMKFRELFIYFLVQVDALLIILSDALLIDRAEHRIVFSCNFIGFIYF